MTVKPKPSKIISADLIHAAYRPTVNWLSPILSAVRKSPKLAPNIEPAKWSKHRLSDLGFTITTRLTNIREAIRHFDENARILGQQLLAEPSPHAWAGKAYPFDDVEALHRLLLAGGSLLAESSAAFDNLVEFYRAFREHVFLSKTPKSEAEARVIAFGGGGPWAVNLARLRNDVLHRRAPWLAFAPMPRRPNGRFRVEPILVLNWRPTAGKKDDFITLQHLRDVLAGLHASVDGMRKHLVRAANR